jgi:hypothetical protein
MGLPRLKVLPGEVGEVGSRIEAWRRRRVKRERMPSELWDCAVELASRHGVCRVARALGIGYAALQKRVTGLTKVRPSLQVPTHGFVELGGFSASGWSGTEIEITDRDGSRLAIRIAQGAAVDLAGLVTAFRGHAG